MQLLFFDTFSHELPAAGVSGAAADQLNLDLVQFPSPVCVREVRVIPLGAKVHSNLPGGARMGATNPAKFDLELFVNNLRAQGKCYIKQQNYIEMKIIKTVTIIKNIWIMNLFKCVDFEVYQIKHRYIKPKSIK